ncbi:MAG: transcriptional regulator, partial [Acinetobacter sp.]
MDIDAISKALANPLRRQILQWLKQPSQYFPVEEYNGYFERGV